MDWMWVGGEGGSWYDERLDASAGRQWAEGD